MSDEELKEFKLTIDWSLEIMEISLKALNKIADNCYSGISSQIAEMALIEISKSKDRIKNN